MLDDLDVLPLDGAEGQLLREAHDVRYGLIRFGDAADDHGVIEEEAGERCIQVHVLRFHPLDQLFLLAVERHQPRVPQLRVFGDRDGGARVELGNEIVPDQRSRSARGLGHNIDRGHPVFVEILEEILLCSQPRRGVQQTHDPRWHRRVAEDARDPLLEVPLDFEWPVAVKNILGRLEAVREFVPHGCSIVSHGELEKIVVTPAHVESEHIE
mmetsp:Transcript_62086/g.170844  ORF Transcript_62086/g.170844 Transcript_62086/m.170844 type:complete len:212 (-) Transcript_62086:354-989(-)